MVAETRAELGIAVAILEAGHRCVKQCILVCRVYSEWLNLLICRQCVLDEALRLIQWHRGIVDGELAVAAL